ncbi:hypothetical protein C8J56DRAFT_1051334 [Mycena floridula]|nr:hypothetical protein C8J56DRAFT_1051334 [Mycena floridula]
MGVVRLGRNGYGTRRTVPYNGRYTATARIPKRLWKQRTFSSGGIGVSFGSAHPDTLLMVHSFRTIFPQGTPAELADTSSFRDELAAMRAKKAAKVKAAAEEAARVKAAKDAAAATPPAATAAA